MRQLGLSHDGLGFPDVNIGPILADTEVASLLSYVRGQFGARSEPITAEMVSRVRAANQKRTQYWRVDELLEKP